MNTLELIAHNWRTHGTRDAYPADAEAATALATKTPQSIHPQRGALLSDCISYDQGQPLFYHVIRPGPIVFIRLSTRTEYRNS